MNWGGRAAESGPLGGGDVVRFAAGSPFFSSHASFTTNEMGSLTCSRWPGVTAEHPQSQLSEGAPSRDHCRAFATG